MTTSRLPPWLRRSKRDLVSLRQMKKKLRNRSLHTVCEAARCPNIVECFARPTATFLLMGDVCTRDCRFCNIETGKPKPLDENEPEQVADAAAEMDLRHIVVTSVTRDDLPLGGAEHFAATVRAIKNKLPEATVEVLTPDFQGSREALACVAQAPIDVFNHNLETVQRLYPNVRPGADYHRSLQILSEFARLRPDVLNKSGMMLGLGETPEEIEQLLYDLREADVSAVTIGQYMRPRLANLPVNRYLPPEEFEAWRLRAHDMGFSHVASAPLVRSSYLADKMIDGS